MKKSILIYRTAQNAESVQKLIAELIEKGYSVQDVCLPEIASRTAASEEEIKRLLSEKTEDVDILVCIIDNVSHSDSICDWEVELAHSRSKVIVGVYSEGFSADTPIPRSLELYRDHLVGCSAEKVASAIEGVQVVSENPDGSPKGKVWNVDKSEC